MNKKSDKTNEIYEIYEMKKNEKRIKKQSITKAQKTNDKERVKRHSDRKTAKKC